MRIFYSQDSDPKILDSVDGLSEIHSRLQAFAGSDSVELKEISLTDGDPSPYSEFLMGFKIKKNYSAEESVVIENNWVVMRLGSSGLERFLTRFTDIDDGDHNHWYSTPISLIVQADDDREADISDL